MKVTMMLAVGLMLAVAGTAGAAGLVNGSFENGLTGWTTQTSQGGSVDVVTTFQEWNPTDGTHFAVVTTGDHIFNPDFQLLYQTPTIAAGSTLSFDYWFDADTLIGQDIAQISLNSTVIASATADTPGEFQGHWVHFVTAPLPTTGAYTIQFGTQKGSLIGISHLGVDNVVVTAPIPEPVTMMGLFAGISGIGAYLRKRSLA